LLVVAVEVAPGIVSEEQEVVPVDIELHQVFQYHPVHLLQSQLVPVAPLVRDKQTTHQPTVATEMTQFLAL
jgi:hypothetical protein